MKLTVTNQGQSSVAPKQVTERAKQQMKSKDPAMTKALSGVGSVDTKAGIATTVKTKKVTSRAAVAAQTRAPTPPPAERPTADTTPPEEPTAPTPTPPTAPTPDVGSTPTDAPTNDDLNQMPTWLYPRKRRSLWCQSCCCFWCSRQKMVRESALELNWQ